MSNLKSFCRVLTDIERDIAIQSDKSLKNDSELSKQNQELGTLIETKVGELEIALMKMPLKDDVALKEDVKHILNNLASLME